jgi:hypothetical protein
VCSRLESQVDESQVDESQVDEPVPGSSVR